MLIVLSPILSWNAKIICGYNFLSPLRSQTIENRKNAVNCRSKLTGLPINLWQVGHGRKIYVE